MRLPEPDADPASRPLISVVMANYESGAKLEPAIGSVLGQTIGDIEVLVCDDASGDDSRDRIAAIAARDPRVRLVPAETNGGPARARNRGLEIARGEWIAIVDADDIIHPERFERLLAAAGHFKADIVADDLLHFYEDGSPTSLLLAPGQDTPFSVSANDWLRAGLDGSPALGYLKPMIRARVLGNTRYDTTLRIGEDFDLVLRLLLAGAMMVVVPEPFYLYRRHKASISHRLSVSDMEGMLESHEALATRLGALEPGLASPFTARGRQLRDGLAFERLVGALKSRRFGAALAGLARHPDHALRLWRSFIEGRRRRVGSHQPAPAPLSSVVLDQATFELPDYVPAGAVDWTAPRPRRVWTGLADLGRGEPIDVVCLDRAAQYAAGFIPLARASSVPSAAELEASVR